MTTDPLAWLHDPPAPAGYDRYPWAGLGRRDVVVLLDDDPLVAPERRPDPANYGGQGWTCVLDIGCVAFEATVTAGEG